MSLPKHLQPRKLVLLDALRQVGVQTPEAVIELAAVVADQLAAVEAETDKHSPSYRRRLLHEADAIQTYLPAIWEFVTAGHRGGGA